MPALRLAAAGRGPAAASTCRRRWRRRCTVICPCGIAHRRGRGDSTSSSVVGRGVEVRVGRRVVAAVRRVGHAGQPSAPIAVARASSQRGTGAPSDAGDHADRAARSGRTARRATRSETSSSSAPISAAGDERRAPAPVSRRAIGAGDEGDERDGPGGRGGDGGERRRRRAISASRDALDPHAEALRGVVAELQRAQRPGRARATPGTSTTIAQRRAGGRGPSRGR